MAAETRTLSGTVWAEVASAHSLGPIRQVSELRGTGSRPDNEFGSAVAVSGTTIVVGASYPAPGAERVYVFTKAGTGWRQTAELQNPERGSGDFFGASVAVSGNTIVVGAPYSPLHGQGWAGRAYVFTRTATGWHQAAALEGSDTIAGDFFGTSVAVSGTTVLVGATGLNSTSGLSSGGRAYVFSKIAKGWHQTAELKGSDTVGDDLFGWSVAIEGRTAVVGSEDLNDGPGIGTAYVFYKTIAGWRQEAELRHFEDSVAISGKTIVLGDSAMASNAGRAFVVKETSSGWQGLAELKGSDTAADDFFGASVTISGTTVVVGAASAHASAGRAYVFTEAASGWRQTAELKGSDTVKNDLFGHSVAISGTTIVIGAPHHPSQAGCAYVFQADHK